MATIICQVFLFVSHIIFQPLEAVSSVGILWSTSISIIRIFVHYLHQLYWNIHCTCMCFAASILVQMHVQVFYSLVGGWFCISIDFHGIAYYYGRRQTGDVCQNTSSLIKWINLMPLDEVWLTWWSSWQMLFNYPKVWFHWNINFFWRLVTCLLSHCFFTSIC